MPINNFSLSQITERIMLTLPVKFSRETTSNVYKFYQALADGFLISTSQIDELFRQTSLATASGSYVDSYVSTLSGLGRFKEGDVYLDNDETDADLIERYKNTLYVYNSSRTGITQVVIDMVGNAPMDMYTGNKKGAYASAHYFYGNGSTSLYGKTANNPFVGYIEFSRKPNDYLIEELRKTINKCRAFGIRLYLKYPDGDDLDIDLTEVSGMERVEVIV